MGHGFVSPRNKLGNWETAIQRVEQSSKEYFDYAVDVGGTSWAVDGDLCPYVNSHLHN